MTLRNPDWLDPAACGLPWPANVGACMTTRVGGLSDGAHASLDLGGEREEDGRPAPAVRHNRRLLRDALGLDAIRFLEQVHGTEVHVEADGAGPAGVPVSPPTADACVMRAPGVAACVLVADCLPVLLADERGAVVAAAHAGWRGLASGVLERTVEAMGAAPAELLVWLGPAIGQQAFEVGPEVRAAFVDAAEGQAVRAAIEAAFRPGREDRWHADLEAIARARLGAVGVDASRIGGGGQDVWGAPSRFFSYRRDRGRTGRQAALIWISRRRSRRS